jgi:hypothetical protein
MSSVAVKFLLFINSVFVFKKAVVRASASPEHVKMT